LGKPGVFHGESLGKEVFKMIQLGKPWENLGYWEN
jgi:hypothetical protein